MSIQIVGWYGEGNVGDEAFKPAFSALFSTAHIGLDALKFASSVEGAPKAVVLGGGDVIKPFYLDRIQNKTKIYPVGVGFGYESEVLLLQNRLVPQMFVRNKQDAEIANRANINATYIPDLTFLLPSECATKCDVPGARKQMAVLITDELSPWAERNRPGEDMYHEYFKWELAGCLDELSQYYDISFIPFSTVKDIDDRRAAGDVYRRMKKKDGVTINNSTLDVTQARIALSHMDLIVSMKYHGVLFAVQMGKPFINIGLTRKTRLFCAENDLLDFSVEPYSFERSRFLAAVKKSEAATGIQHIRSTGARLQKEALSGYTVAAQVLLAGQVSSAHQG